MKSTIFLFTTQILCAATVLLIDPPQMHSTIILLNANAPNNLYIAELRGRALYNNSKSRLS